MGKDILTTVIQTIADHQHIDPTQINLESKLSELGVSSLDAITIVYELEEAFDVEVPTDSLQTLERVDDIVSGINSLLEKDA